MTTDNNDNNNMQPSITFDEEYCQWVQQLCQRYRQSQVKAAVKVNDEMLRFYWSVGRDISERQFANRYGTKFFATASRDIQKELGFTHGLSERSLRYTASMYELYSPLFKDVDSILRQPAAKFQRSQQPVEDSGVDRKLQHLAAEFDFPDFGQLLGYVAMVNDRLNTPGDNPAIGLLICQEKDNVLAQYALSNTQVPVSIAEYRVARQQLPPELQSQLPTEEEIEETLRVTNFSK